MNKYLVGIDGMGCGMCEVHVQDTIRKNLDVKKVKASRFKKNLIVICEQDLSEEDFRKFFDKTGYKVTSYLKEKAVKKFIGWK